MLFLTISIEGFSYTLTSGQNRNMVFSLPMIYRVFQRYNDVIIVVIRLFLTFCIQMRAHISQEISYASLIPRKNVFD